MGVSNTVRQTTRKNLGTVTAAEDIGDGLRHFTFSPREQRLSWQPGQGIGVIVDPDGRSLKDRWRHYTIAGRTDDGSFRMLLSKHGGGGPGVEWVLGLEPGDSFVFMGPGGGPKLDPAHDHYLLAGDRTSVASITAMADALPAEAKLDVVIATPDPTTATLPTTRPDTAVTWVAAESADEIEQGLLTAVDDLPIPTGRAYITGELATVKAIRKRLTERGLSGRQIGTHAHWAPGKRGL
ncbi:MAG: siderophore-interacting protein [Actinomycetota bacterium]